MAESKSEVAQATSTQAPHAPHAPRAPRAASAREVLAARIRTAELTGVLSPKMQRSFDRIASNLGKVNK